VEKKTALISQILMMESDRGSAIFAAALMDEALEVLLRSFFRDDPASVKSAVDPLFATYAPLSTFSAKIQICFALNLIPSDLRTKLETIRRLRSDFAHQSGPIDSRIRVVANDLIHLWAPRRRTRKTWQSRKGKSG